MNAAPDMLAAGLKMLAALGLVLALMLVLLYAIRRLAGQGVGIAGRKQIQLIESHYMGPKKNISLVRIPGKVLVLGISADRINLLDILDAHEVQAGVQGAETAGFRAMFNDRLKKIGGRFRAEEPR